MASALPDVTGVYSDVESVAASDTSNEDKGLISRITWDADGVTLDHVSKEVGLPCVCQFEEDIPPLGSQADVPRLSQGLRIYSRQPVLLHTRSRKFQVRARTVAKDPSGAYYELGQTLIIPDDYPGWFELVPSDFSRATCYLSIGAVAAVMPPRFFTRSNLKGIRIEGEGEQQKYLERKIPSGSVLQTNGNFTAKWKTVAQTGMLKKKTKEWELAEVTYLRCLEKDGLEILVPHSHKGKFNTIYERGKLTANAVYSMKDIRSDLSLPIKVRLLYGKAPVVPCIFTGILILRETCMDDVITGSTICNRRNVLFELPAKSPVTVKYTSNNENFRDVPSFKDAEKLCRKYAPLYSAMIKLSPEQDTDQKVIQHVPSDPSVMRQSNETLRALDLITDISLSSTEPQDHLLDGSEAGSAGSGPELPEVMPAGAKLDERSEYEFKGRESHTFV